MLPAGRRGLPAGVLHYAPREHALELRCSLGKEAGEALAAALPEGAFLVGLTSILWREAWKYGERAFRYCALDTGHALAAVDFAAAGVGYRAAAVGRDRAVAQGTWSDAEVAQLLGVDRESDFAALDVWEHEHPDVLMLLMPAEAAGTCEVSPSAVLDLIATGTWHGTPNVLSEEHHEWDVIHATAEATRRGARGASARPAEAESPVQEASTSDSAPVAPAAQRAVATVAGQEQRATLHDFTPLAAERLNELALARRSAVSMIAGDVMPRATFARLLDATLVRPGAAPWRGWSEPSRAHLLVFVHRVEGLPRGLYLLERGAADHDELVVAMASELEWERVQGVGALRLFRLRSGACEGPARNVACQQDIAADGAFSLGMLTRVGSVVAADASAYRRLFWECGAIGQVLYLEAEAAGWNATGIGCFFDDSVHALVGVTGDEWQVLYHFTVGRAAHDARLRTLPPYAHLERTE